MPQSLWLFRVGLTLLTPVAVGALAAPAQAASVGVASVDGTKVQYKAASGKQSKVVVTRSGMSVTIDDVVAVKAGKGCKKLDSSKVRCTMKKAPTRVRIYTYDRNDSIVNKSDLAMTADGGTGNDRITGGPRGDLLRGYRGNDTIWGLGGNDTIDSSYDNDRVYGGDGGDEISDGFGNDIVHGNNGDDVLDGEPGNDRFYGDAGDDFYRASYPYKQEKADADYFSGGAGTDYADYAFYHKGVTIDADGVKGDDGVKGEHDTLAADIEVLWGSGYDDHIYGTGRQDVIQGLAGNDVIYGFGGNDRLSGDDGIDKVYGGAGDDSLSGEDWGNSNRKDLLDAGTNGTSGDYCYPTASDVTVGCEYIIK
ncbi:calcium-binding protein [Actinoplanes hulinensis]|uniref:Calcium-binding protein n=1 Tax=Actinoplanes hulinensis TaxID=1144547 RepID=A0ABS7BAZ7_9ACTN|nr:calcium-binding protein [Actinoplanes hulinensis]MBW6438227.1 calcium-binding protein [Actinoplanes hulinensis]